MIFYPFLLFILGLVIITIGADLILKGATKIASLFGVSPILIGLTIVSIGTSLPELAVGITAVQEGASDIAVGNIAGTNIVNILLILGLSAAIRPLPIHLKAIKLEVMAMILSAVLLFLLSIDGTLSAVEGFLMLILGAVYIISLIKKSKNESKKVIREYVTEYQRSTKKEKHDWKKWLLNSLILIAGMIGTIYGAEILVEGAVDIAKAFGVSDTIIGLTIVAIGTSAPELTTTIMATIKNERDVAIGNLLGSSITNILFILAITCLFAPQGLNVNNDILWFDLPLATLVAIACYPVFKSGKMVSRTEGISFATAYLIYIGFLVFVRA